MSKKKKQINRPKQSEAQQSQPTRRRFLQLIPAVAVAGAAAFGITLFGKDETLEDHCSIEYLNGRNPNKRTIYYVGQAHTDPLLEVQPEYVAEIQKEIFYVLMHLIEDRGIQMVNGEGYSPKPDEVEFFSKIHLPKTAPSGAEATIRSKNAMVLIAESYPRVTMCGFFSSEFAKRYWPIHLELQAQLRETKSKLDELIARNETQSPELKKRHSELLQSYRSMLAGNTYDSLYQSVQNSEQALAAHQIKSADFAVVDGAHHLEDIRHIYNRQLINPALLEKYNIVLIIPKGAEIAKDSYEADKEERLAALSELIENKK